MNKMCRNGHPMNLTFEGRIRWRCRIRGCRQEVSLRVDNWLEGSKLPIRTIVLFIYCWSFDMSTIKFCERELGMSSNSVVDWSNFLREVCASHLLANPQVIGGPNLTVEIDESLFTRRKNNAGRVLPQQWVFGGICRETNDAFLFTIPDRSANTLMPIIQQSILPGTTVISDEWRAYNQINNAGYNHMTVNHSVHFVDPNTGANTQKVESMWRNAKMKNKKMYGTHRNMLDSYLCEFMWRRRINQAHPFDSILQHIVDFWPPQ